MMKEKVVLLIPLTYNDGSSVPDDVLQGIYDDLFVLCGGHTTLGPVKGAYRMADGRKQVDEHVQVWVVVERSAIPRLRKLVRKFAMLLGQETMYFERSGAEVEFIGSKSTPRRRSK